MRLSEITAGLTSLPKIKPDIEEATVIEVPIKPLISGFETWTTIEERAILDKLKKPKKLKSLSEHEQFRIQALIRKNLVTKSGDKEPTVVANEEI